MDRNPVRDKLRAGGTPMGVMAFDFFTPALAPILKDAGAEFVILDMEHSGAGIDTIKGQCALARGAGLVPMARVPACLHHLIAPVLDAGAMGIMAPLVETREHAEILVNACRYRPLGRRGLAFGLAHDGYAPGAARAKMDAANESVLTIALIESAKGIENCDAILATPGLDLAWIGHFDLSDSLGCVEAFDDPVYVAAEKRLMAAAHAAGKPLGWLVGTGVAARDAIARGFRCICIGHELLVFRNAMAREFADARKA